MTSLGIVVQPRAGGGALSLFEQPDGIVESRRSIVESEMERVID